MTEKTTTYGPAEGDAARANLHQLTVTEAKVRRRRASPEERAEARERVLDVIRENREALGWGFPDVRIVFDLTVAVLDDRYCRDAGEAVRVCQAAASLIERMRYAVPPVLHGQAEVAAGVGKFSQFGRFET